MKSVNVIYKNSNQFEQSISQISSQIEDSILIQVFSGQLNIDKIKSVLKHIHQLLPNATIIGASSTGEIIEDTVQDETITVSLSQFQSTQVHISASNHPDLQQAGQDIRQHIIHTDTKAVIAFSAGFNATPALACNTIIEGRPDIILAGGIAGDNNKMIANYIINGTDIMTSGIVAVSLSGANLVAENALKFNWQPIGKYLTITKAEGNIIHEINHQPLSEIYRHYLGKTVGDNLPSSATVFPLTQDKDGILVSKVFLQTTKEGAGIFTGVFEDGEQVRFAYANSDMLLDNSYLEGAFNYQMSALYVYSCGGRRKILDKDINNELAALAKLAPTVGMFTYGEFYTSANGQIETLNTTMTILALSEHNGVPKLFQSSPSPVLEDTNKFDFSTSVLMQSLTYFTKVITSELREANDKLTSLNLTDFLTGIPNRRHFEQHLPLAWKMSIRAQAEMAVIMIDIDHFKQFNDNYGHGLGDSCLRKVAQTLHAQSSRDIDLIARYGGEEFVGILPMTDEAGALMIAEKMLQAVLRLAIPHEHSTVSDVISISIGVCCFKAQAHIEPEKLLYRADQCLYEAKKTGRNKVVTCNQL